MPLISSSEWKLTIRVALDQLLEKEQNAFWELYLGPSAVSIPFTILEGLEGLCISVADLFLRLALGGIVACRSHTNFHHCSIPP